MSTITDVTLESNEDSRLKEVTKEITDLTYFEKIKPISKTDKVLELGPLESLLPCSESKVLDFLITFREYDYSISDVSKNSGVGFKTTLGVIKTLESREVIVNIRNVGRAKMYKLNPDSKEASALRKLALDIAVSNAKQNQQ